MFFFAGLGERDFFLAGFGDVDLLFPTGEGNLKILLRFGDIGILGVLGIIGGDLDLDRDLDLCLGGNLKSIGGVLGGDLDLDRDLDPCLGGNLKSLGGVLGGDLDRDLDLCLGVLGIMIFEGRCDIINTSIILFFLIFIQP